MAGLRLPGTIRRLEWPRSYRIIPSAYPPINLFEEVALPSELDSVLAVESLTNPRLLDAVGRLSLVPQGDRLSGPGTSPIMAAFTHPNLDGSRFSDGSFGVYYAAREERTAIEESAYHRERLLGMQNVGAQEIAMRAYRGRIDADMRDVRGLREAAPWLYDPRDYSRTQRFGAHCREAQEWGIAYHSVRCEGGQCVAVLKPPACHPVNQFAHYLYHYDGQRITRIDRVTPVR